MVTVKVEAAWPSLMLVGLAVMVIVPSGFTVTLEVMVG